MKNKRNIINKYLSQYEELGIDTIIYYNSKAHRTEVLWFKESDMYITRNGQFTLKQFYKYITRLNNLKAFW
ncbi:MAG TPA: hypothetical protein VII94_01055 [Candidatus Saccharimonadales bacterium]